VPLVEAGIRLKAQGSGIWLRAHGSGLRLAQG